MEVKRTGRQNNSLHRFFRLLAADLNDAGLDMRKTLREDIEVPWTEELVKDHLWRPIQEAVVNKESTTELEKDEVDKVYNVLNRHLGQKLGIYTPFPKDESRKGEL